MLEENVQLAIANIEKALSPKVVCSNLNTEANVSESTSANEVQIGIKFFAAFSFNIEFLFNCAEKYLS